MEEVTTIVTTISSDLQETNVAESIVSDTVQQTKQVTTLLSQMQEQLLGFLPNIINAIVFFIIGLMVSQYVLKLLIGIMDKSTIDKTASGFVKSAIKIAMYIFLVVIVLSILNVPMSSIVTVIGTIGVTIGLALKDSLSNVAGGFIILLNRPLKVGDYIEAQGVAGTVEQISIFYTTIVTVDNKTIHIPNGNITNSNVINFNQKECRKLELEYTISYDADFKKAQSLIKGILDKDDKVMHDKDIVVRMGRQDASSIVIFVKVWVRSNDYHELSYDINEQVKEQFDLNHIEIPYNQLDVHVKGSAELIENK